MLAANGSAIARKGHSNSDELYQERVNPQWVRLLDVLQMNARYTRCEGTELFTEDGRRILDFTSGQMSAILGHAHPEIAATVSRQISTLDHLFSGMLSRPVVELSRRLAESLPAPLSKALLLTTGADTFAVPRSRRIDVAFAASRLISVREA